MLRRAARAYGNWTATTIDDALRRTSALTVGPLQADLQRQADDARVGAGGAPAGTRSESTVESVVVRGAGPERRAIIVTRDSVTGRGVTAEGDIYKVTLAEVTQTAAGWAISSWEPQP